MEKIEKRYCASGLELRSDGEGKESRTIVGYAAVFDSDSVDMGFTERLNKNCFDGVIERSNVVALYNHSETPGILARSDKGKGTLSLSVDDKGLRCEFEAPNTQLGNDMLESVRRGDISRMSFAFTVEKDNWEHVGSDTYVRTIIQIRQLYDVSLVLTPAYEATSVETKGLDELKAKEILEQHKRSAPNDEYFETLEREIYN
jgi:phage prohead protease, HK97 family